MLSVEIKYHTFESVSHQRQLGRATNQDQDIYEEAKVLFRELWDGTPVRLLGIRSSKLVQEDEPEQLSLFDPQFQPDPKREQLNQALAKVRGKYGDRIVRKGCLDKEIITGYTNNQKSSCELYFYSLQLLFLS